MCMCAIWLGLGLTAEIEISIRLCIYDAVCPGSLFSEYSGMASLKGGEVQQGMFGCHACGSQA